ncbi:p12 [Euproctis pseudoconspersa nucleopolyhedrovirus]|uniref:p12 n=1 Tax=Euproctis pseudoconspersa nucleopolyhedrovirus TaxID=307467 RepID=C3TWZ7_9ABAC|nr:p12 [Euproctis pseudoconspersa nucleopolyhedrovirus]ACO53539.1 p12 [Euproctis pseudoconspersa nucleopolyhedrovirus]
MSSDDLNDFIDTIDPIIKKPTKKIKRNARFDPIVDRRDGGGMYASPVDLINVLSESDDNRTVSIVLKDESKHKMESFKMLSGKSAVAKEILKDIQENRDALPMNTLRATNVLRFLSNLYDNQF